MPNPSQVSSQNVNSELGVSTTTQLSWGNNWARNVATQYTGTNSTVNASKFRWGINFLGGDLYSSSGIANFTKQYSNSANLSVGSEIFTDGTAAAARANLQLNSNGTIVLKTVAGGITNTYTTTWLTSGVAGDYTANLVINAQSGTGTLLGDSTNTAYALSTSRSWEMFRNQPTVGAGTGTLYANLVITNTSGGATLIQRPVVLFVYTERLT